MIRQRLLKDQVLSDRERKNIAILELIGKSGPMTKTDISKITELNVVTVSNYINNYIQADLVKEIGFDVSSGGRKPTLVDLNYESGYVVGVGLDHKFDKIVCVLLNYASHLVKKKIVPCDPKDRSEGLIEKIADVVDQLISESGVNLSKIKGIGLSLPGTLDERGETVKWPSSVGKMDIMIYLPVRAVFEKRFRIPVFIERNDVSAVAGERWMNLSSDVQNVLFMYSGMGCGYITCGQLFRGPAGTAGLLGVKKLEEENFTDLCKDDFDLGISKKIEEYIQSGQEVKIADKENVTLESIIQAAADGDRVCLEVIQDAGERLGRKVAFLVNFLNPEVVLIGGGIEEGCPLFLDSVRKSIKKYSVDEATNILKVMPSTLKENLFAMGGASIVIQELFAQV
ncbi:hypothetical protein AB834_04855 [PVC group bacterium (ex Bugula neritina AB1)]|nr:hypothetical protein AB834_04855 [PVC group bacterium (ex Bugula neritina AB1)]